jgi:hypothetical protein
VKDLQFYWLFIAPATLLCLQAIGWIVLWVTRPRENHNSHDQKQMALNLR